MSEVAAPPGATASAAAAGNSKLNPDSGASSSGPSSAAALSEDNLQKELKSALETLDNRKLNPTYKKMLERNPLTRRAATIPKNKFYERIGSRLRERVEVYTREMQGKDPFDRISQRKPLDEAGMRAAFTLREAKKHEQEPFLEATLAAMAMHPERKRSLDGMALGLQQRNKKKIRAPNSLVFGSSAAAQIQMARENTVLEDQKLQARQLEEARIQREREERRKRMEEIEQNKRTNSGEGGSNSNLQKVFNKYWDMEFPNLGNMNPFRIVIDRKSAPQIAPTYFDVITTPMNLTYIRDKVKGGKYLTYQQFFADIDLMIDNALKFNQGEDNPYRIAAEDLKKKHAKIAKRVWKYHEQNKS